jgi:hypothetical protein
MGRRSKSHMNGRREKIHVRYEKCEESHKWKKSMYHIPE